MTITLATLAQATEQEVFDQVVAHLRKQGRKALSIDGNCQYRGREGTMCAAGCLMSDDEVHPKFEGTVWFELVENGSVPRHHNHLIGSLQDVRDNRHVEEWENWLEVCAEDHALSYTKP